MAIYNPVTIIPYTGAAAALKGCLPPLLCVRYLELLVKQQLHHQLSDAEHLGRHAEQREQVVENGDLEVGQH